MYTEIWGESEPFRSLLRGKFGQNEEYGTTAGFFPRTPALATDTTIKIPGYFDDIRPDTVVFRCESVSWEYGPHLGLIREIEVGQDARFWAGETEEFGLEKGLYGSRNHIDRFRFTVAPEMKFGPSDKRFLSG